MDAAGRPIGFRFHVPETLTYPQLLRQNLISCSGILLKKRWCQKFPMDADVFHEDFLNWLSMLRYGAAAGGIDLPLHTVRIGRPRSKSGNKLRSAAANLQTYRRLGFSPTQIAFYMSCYLRRRSAWPPATATGGRCYESASGPRGQSQCFFHR